MSSNINRSASWLQSVPLHPFLFAIYPILALLAFNISELDISSGFRPLLLSLFLAGVLMLVSYVVYGD
jgi:hypothetical protein